MAVAAELNARQRKHVHMHSSIFDAGGPESQSVYLQGRQQAVYENLKSTLGSANRHHRPELSMPSAGDIKCTQNAGHGVVLPSNYAIQPSQRPSSGMTGPEVLVYDGEAGSVLHAAARDHAAIPKEFWSTSVNLQWHDTRNEKCRGHAQVLERQQMGAQEMKRQELSSEVFGKARMTEASTSSARHELLADSADFLKMDSSHCARSRPSTAPGGARQQEEVAARDRFQHNLAGSVHNNLPRAESRPQVQVDEPSADREVAERRRRQEKNFSDLFGTQMGERNQTRDREEVTATRSCSFLDMRSEIAARNKGHWRPDELDGPSRRKEAEYGSRLFERATAEKPAMEPQVAQVLHGERAAWDTQSSMHGASEIARRQRQKDHLKDFADLEGHTHLSRKQADMGSEQIRLNLGAPAAPKYEPTSIQRFGPPVDSPRKGLNPVEREQLLCSAKDTKLASLQSSIFS